MIDLHFLISSALGAFVGLLLGLTGAGGGIVSVPLLVFGLHMPVSEAGPIGLVAIGLSTSIGALHGLKEKQLRSKAAIFMSLFGLLFSPFGLWLAQKLPNTPLLVLFALVLLYVSARMWMQASQTLSGKAPQRTKAPPCQLDLSIGKLIWTMPCARALMFAGAIAGLLSGLLGVGGGFIIVPSLKKFTDLPMKAIIATSLGVLALVSAGGAFISLASGTLNLPIAIPFALGALGGIFIGKALEKRLSGARVQQIFSAFTLLVAISLIFKAL